MRIYYIIGVAAALLTGCSQIDMDERLEEIPFIPAEQIVRNVLVEDFTGQNCPNCPTAAEAIEYLEEGYPGHVIAVSLHAGNLALNTPLYSDEAQHYFSLLGDPNLPQPALRVNRSGALLVGGIAAKNDLHPAVRAQLLAPTDVTISHFTASEQVSVTLSSSKPVDAVLQLWVLEDGIKSRQSMPTGAPNPRYEHHSVYRASITPLDGMAVSLTKEPTTVELPLSLSEQWKAENLSVVAIVSQPGGEVLQVEKVGYAQ